MQLNDAGIQLVKNAEGCKLTAYPDPGSGGDPWTIGWGSTGPDIKMGLVWTQYQCDQRLKQDLQAFSLSVQRLLDTTLTDNQFSALVSFAYNLGARTLAGSTLMKLVNQEEFEDAANEFVKWNHAGGKVLPGLTARRLAEKALFETPDS